MKIAIPTDNGRLCPHFGHCSEFTIIDIDETSKKISNIDRLNPPPHDRGVLPAWLTQMGCTHIIAGGMGGRAVSLFEQNGIHVTLGAPQMEPEKIVQAHLDGQLQTGGNPCDDPAFHQGHDGQCHSHEN